jgi:MFS transporter, FHS family, L-fucose permease
LGALFVLASGLSFLETASNPIVAQLGLQHSSEQRLNFSQAFNSLGSISGLPIGTIFIFSRVKLTPGQTASVRAQNLY